MLLVASLVPMLSFMGHWPESVPIPGTDQYLSVPFAGVHTHEEEDAHAHSQHCHGNSASCSDVPALVGAGFALIRDVLSFGTAGGLLLLLALQWWLPRGGAFVSPELQPPKGLATS
jgi:hypothetical protein